MYRSYKLIYLFRKLSSEASVVVSMLTFLMFERADPTIVPSSLIPVMVTFESLYLISRKGRTSTSSLKRLYKLISSLLVGLCEILEKFTKKGNRTTVVLISV